MSQTIIYAIGILAAVIFAYIIYKNLNKEEEKKDNPDPNPDPEPDKKGKVGNTNLYDFTSDLTSQYVVQCKSLNDGEWNKRFTGTKKYFVDGYFQEWSIYDDRNYFLKDVIDTQTHLNGIYYSFANIYKANKAFLNEVLKEYQIGSKSYILYKSIHDQLTSDTDVTYVSWLTSKQNNFQSGDVDGGDQWGYFDNYNFINPQKPDVIKRFYTSDQTAQLKGNLADLKYIRKIKPEMNIFISVGGYTQSVYFSPMAKSDRDRKNFIDTFINFYLDGNLFQRHGGDGAGAGIYNGVSIDWEFPAVPNGWNIFDKLDGTYMMYLFRDLKQALSVKGYGNFIVSTAILANPPKMGLDTTAWYNKSSMEGNAVSNNDLNPEFNEQSITQKTGWENYVDEIHLMSYDYMGGWDLAKVGPQCNFMPSNETENIQNNPVNYKYETSEFSTARALRYLVDVVKIPKNKIHIGIPFYGRGWLFKQDGTVSSFQGKFEQCINDTKEFINKLEGGIKYNEFKDQAYGIQKTTDGNIFWTFDDPVTIRKKVQITKQCGYGGVFCWAFDGDIKGTADLLKAMETIKN